MPLSDKKTVYHSTLVQHGPVEATVKTQVQKSKYPNNPDYVVIIVEGKEHNLAMENDQYKAAFASMKGRNVLITATGGKGDAFVEVQVTGGGSAPAQAPAQPAARPPQQQSQPAASAPAPSDRGNQDGVARPRQQPAARTKEQILADRLDSVARAEKNIRQSVQLFKRCVNAAVDQAMELASAFGVTGENAEELRRSLAQSAIEETIKTLPTTLFIRATGAGTFKDRIEDFNREFMRDYPASDVEKYIADLKAKHDSAKK